MYKREFVPCQEKNVSNGNRSLCGLHCFKVCRGIGAPAGLSGGYAMSTNPLVCYDAIKELGF
jgi:hypothetical protein